MIRALAPLTFATVAVLLGSGAAWGLGALLPLLAPGLNAALVVLSGAGLLGVVGGLLVRAYEAATERRAVELAALQEENRLRFLLIVAETPGPYRPPLAGWIEAQPATREPVASYEWRP